MHQLLKIHQPCSPRPQKPIGKRMLYFNRRLDPKEKAFPHGAVLQARRVLRAIRKGWELRNDESAAKLMRVLGHDCVAGSLPRRVAAYRRHDIKLSYRRGKAKT
jgi:hypothetical protein